MKRDVHEDRLQELLLERSLHGLSAAQTCELESLDHEVLGARPSSWDLAAAALHQAFLAPSLDDLPDGLRAQVERRARRLVADEGSGREQPDTYR